jgi:hypothetical protein
MLRSLRFTACEQSVILACSSRSVLFLHSGPRPAHLASGTWTLDLFNGSVEVFACLIVCMALSMCLANCVWTRCRYLILGPEQTRLVACKTHLPDCHVHRYVAWTSLAFSNSLSSTHTAHGMPTPQQLPQGPAAAGPHPPPPPSAAQQEQLKQLPLAYITKADTRKRPPASTLKVPPATDSPPSGG